MAGILKRNLLFFADCYGKKTTSRSRSGLDESVLGETWLRCRIKQAAPPVCKNYFGYLGDRCKQNEIPEECLTCKRTIECMLYDLKKSNIAVKEIQKWYK